MNIRFDGQVAVVTGAGNGLGRSYAIELARRGAKVIVNDLGGAHDGTGQDPQVARNVADEITRAGGVAVANASSVTSDEGVKALVAQALEAFGRIDILIANAGIHRSAPFAQMTLKAFAEMTDLHLMGTVRPVKAVWESMQNQAYGRIVVTTSTVGLFGYLGDAHYGSGKMGVVGLMNTLKLEGEPYGIRVNTIAPIAATRMGRDAVSAADWELFARKYSPDFVTPGVCYLASRDAPSGVILTAGGGVFACAQMLGARGANLGAGADADAVALHWPAISDFSSPVALARALDHGALFNEMIAAGVEPKPPG
jgi:NAD(P)-dependent dehydrogenase (short-subunit alcohol dehydrogenase family)